ncbi:MAG: rod shape-determining protein MreD, partial [Muribaculaceae bacterium]|nr:rod shape-determining protein MreD [Muribaculaceae bacterium]
MNRELVIFGVIFIILVLLQVLICNHIALFNVAIPFLFIFFIIRLPLGLGTNWLYTLSFFLGFFIDIFSDTLGVNSLASVLLASVKKPVFYAYIPRDDKTVNVMPCLATLGWIIYTKYLITMTTIFSFLVFSIEFFSFGSIKDI